MKKASLSAYAVTDVGRVRKNNEDNFYVNGFYKTDTAMNDLEYEDRPHIAEGFFAVCDGMGGEDNGEAASLYAVSVMKEYQKAFRKDFEEAVQAYVEAANERICQDMRAMSVRMGSTVAGLYIKNGVARSFNCGDSRVYLQHEGQLFMITHDHTRAQQLVDAGLLAPEEMNSHKGKHQLTLHLGIYPEECVITPYISSPFEVVSGDMILICSDGVTDMLTDEDINRIIDPEKSAEKNAIEIVEWALERGGRDNTTAVVIAVS